MLASAIGFRADAQSEYMRGDRMPYDAFDRLPKTDLEVPAGSSMSRSRPAFTLPNEKLLNWVRMSAKAVTAYYGRFPVNALRLSGAHRWRPHSGRHHMGLSRRRHSYPDWPRRHRGCAAARLGDGARDGAYRAARYARPICVAIGGPCGLCRAGRAGAAGDVPRRKSGRP